MILVQVVGLVVYELEPTFKAAILYIMPRPKRP
jgi:hypothetical protein